MHVCVWRAQCGLCLRLKVTLTVNSDSGSFSLPPFLPLPSHTQTEYMKTVHVGCYRRQVALPAEVLQSLGSAQFLSIQTKNHHKDQFKLQICESEGFITTSDAPQRLILSDQKLPSVTSSCLSFQTECICSSFYSFTFSENQVQSQFN